MTTFTQTIKLTEAIQNFRSGAWGDPANAPLWVLVALYANGIRGTGYTHEWRTCNPEYRKYLMASVEDPESKALAISMGWRTYGITRETTLPTDTIMCPESTSGGKIDCNTCLLCDGTRRQAKHIAIPPVQNKFKCYVNVGQSPGRVYDSWKAGNIPTVSPESVNLHMLGIAKLPYSSVLVWSGPSPVDGKPIMFIITNLIRDSENSKTGPMVQSFIMRQDIKPVEAIKSGDDESVCGSCPLRPIFNKN
jgi:hypothetical protein